MSAPPLIPSFFMITFFHHYSSFLNLDDTGTGPRNVFGAELDGELTVCFLVFTEDSFD